MFSEKIVPLLVVECLYVLEKEINVVEELSLNVDLDKNNAY